VQAIEAPKANPENLLDIVRDAYRAKVVVPEFQRAFVWSREDIEEFMASVLQGYFVGTFLLLDTPTHSPMFPFRTVEGLEQVNRLARPEQHATVRLVLDGQQRITSVFYVLYAPDIPLRYARYPYTFFLRLDEALNGNLDEAVVGVSQRDLRHMAEMRELEERQQAIRFEILRDSSRFYRWLYNEQRVWGEEDRPRIRNGLSTLTKVYGPGRLPVFRSRRG